MKGGGDGVRGGDSVRDGGDGVRGGGVMVWIT